jgi:Nucleotidyl transferase AbiEii toxin, Type IV TA system
MGMLARHRQVAEIILSAASGCLVGLGGGNALLAYEVTDRPTQDVDVFFGRLNELAEATPAIEAALAAAGYGVAPLDKADGLTEIWEEAGEGLAEWEVTTPDGEHVVQVQAGYFEVLAEPVRVKGIGPVLALDDIAGHKACAMAGRAASRDFVDIAALQEYRTKYRWAKLVELARERDPGLELADFADAVRRLDRMADDRFAALLPQGRDTVWLRKHFSDWPRQAPERAADRGL